MLFRVDINQFKWFKNSEPTTAAATLPPGGVVWKWGNIFDSADLDTSSGEGPKSGLSTLGWEPLGVTTHTGHLDVETVDTEVLEPGSNSLSGEHSGVWSSLITHSTDNHTTGDLDKGFSAGEIGNMDKSIILSGVDMGNTEADFALLLSWTDINIVLGLLHWGNLCLWLWC